jgi:ABC-type uncharacterized transport system substrate-binding protein
MLPLRKLVLGCLLLLTSLANANPAAPLRLLIVQSDASALYQTFTRMLIQKLPENIHAEVAQHAEDFNRQQPDVIVTVGVKAANWVADRSNVPILAAMIPGSMDFLAKRSNKKQLTALYLDQPWGRQLDLIHAAMPLRNKIGLLTSETTHLTMRKLQEELSVHKDTLFIKSLRQNDTLFDDLEVVLSNSEVLLAVPDSAVYNANNIRNILLSSYQKGIPLIGFSAAYVKAGALCAIFSTPEQLAAQASTMIVSFSRTGRLPEAQYPELFSIAVNQEVGRTLGLTIKSAEALRLQMEQSSRGYDERK